MPLYRHEAKVVFFVHIPKTGGTSVERAFRDAGASEAFRFRHKRRFSRSTLQHVHAEIYQEAISPDFYDFGFTIVRNPFHRFASEFKMKVLDAGEEIPAEDWADECFERFGSYPFTRDNHIRPQVEFLADSIEVFRFEDGLTAPLQAGCGALGLPMPAIPHRKRGSATRPTITKRGLELIREFYAEDFDRLGYDPDDCDGAFEIRR